MFHLITTPTLEHPLLPQTTQANDKVKPNCDLGSSLQTNLMLQKSTLESEFQ